MMKKYRKLYKIITIVVFLTIGCIFAIGHFRHKDLNEMVENHKAMQMYRDGIFDVRYERLQVEDSDDSKEFSISIDVKKDMTEEDMLCIMDYFEMTNNASYVGSSYEGEQDTDYTCYAVFYRGDTDEEIRRMKYFNGEEVEITENDNPYSFPGPEKKSERGEERDSDAWL